MTTETQHPDYNRYNSGVFKDYNCSKCGLRLTTRDVSENTCRLCRHEQPASARVDATEEWRTAGQVVPDCDYKISGMTVIQKRTSSELVALTRDKEVAAQILSDHNQHQQCATQLQYLGNRAEELSSLLAGMTTERDGLRRAIEELRARHRERATRANFADCGCDDCMALETLNHAEQGEGSDV